MRRYRITIGGKAFEVDIEEVKGAQARVLVNGRPYEVAFQALAPGAPSSPGAAPPKPVASPPARPAPPKPPPSPPKPSAPALRGGPGAVTAPMPGVILEVLVKVGDQVEAGDTVVKLEAMKMENDIKTPGSGVVAEVLVHKGANVTVGEVLVVVTGG